MAKGKSSEENIHTRVLACACCLLLSTVAWGRPMKWTHFTIANPLPANAWGTGGSPLADYDGDGDLDVVISRRQTKTAYWFERKDDATWVRHVMGQAEGLAKTLGAAAAPGEQIAPGVFELDAMLIELRLEPFDDFVLVAADTVQTHDLAQRIRERVLCEFGCGGHGVPPLLDAQSKTTLESASRLNGELSQPIVASAVERP